MQRILADFPVRLRACIENQGHHFEPWLKQYKRRISRNGVCPQCANQANDDLLCNECNEMMFQVIERDRALDAQQIVRERGDYDIDEDDVLEELGENLGMPDE